MWPDRTPRPPPREPAIPVSKLPQYVSPSRASRGLQIGSFVLSAALGAYAVLLYDFGNRDHCFMPIRSWVDEHTQHLFTLSDAERRTMGLEPTVRPDTHTPIEFFKERRANSQDDDLRRSK